MNKLWQALNSPLIVVLVALALWPVMGALSSGIAVKLGIRQVADAISQEIVQPFRRLGNKQNEEIKVASDVMKQMVLTNLRTAPSSWSKKMKIIGTITNTSESSVKSIRLLVSMYEGEDLVNVNNEWLSDVKLLKPGESSNFAVTSDIQEGKDPKAIRLDVKVSDLGVLE